jgi:nicotinamidase-related amidase
MSGPWAPPLCGTALLLVDVFNDYQHEDGTALYASFCERYDELRSLINWAHRTDVRVVYANDSLGDPRCRRSVILGRAQIGLAGDRVRELQPREQDMFVVKPLYSAFEQTALDDALRRLGVRYLIIAGAATERCVTQTAVSARERDYPTAVVANACSTVDPRQERLALAYLRDVAGVAILTDAWGVGLLQERVLASDTGWLAEGSEKAPFVYGVEESSAV